MIHVPGYDDALAFTVRPPVRLLILGAGLDAVSIQEVMAMFPDNTDDSKRIAITGAPFSGKTTFIERLVNSGEYKNKVVYLPFFMQY